MATYDDVLGDPFASGPMKWRAALDRTLGQTAALLAEDGERQVVALLLDVQEWVRRFLRHLGGA